MSSLSHPKLVTLAETEGFADVAEFLEDHAQGSVMPAICVATDCDHTADLEPDQRSGFCEKCGRPTMQSGLVIAGVI